MAKKLGLTNVNRVGTGKLNNSDTGTDMWAGSAAAQLATASTIKDVLTKTIPTQYVLCDPNNPRKLNLSQEQICSIACQYPLNKTLLNEEDPSDWIEDYLSEVCEANGFKGKAVGDLKSLIEFAATLKSSERLIHPIVVRRDESVFHLIAGERRLLAHILLNESSIPARIIEHDYSKAEIGRLQWEENVQREDMSLWERVSHINTLIELGEGLDKISITKLTKVLGLSRTECQRYLAILRYPDSILIEAIKDGKVNNLKKGATLAQLTPERLKDIFFEKSPNPVTRPIIRLANKKQAPHIGKLIYAAAKQLKLASLIKNVDMNSSDGVNQAVEILVSVLEEGGND